MKNPGKITEGSTTLFSYVIIIGSAGWLIWQDIAYIVPLLGIAGGVISLRRIEDNRKRNVAEEKIKKELSRFIKSDAKGPLVADSIAREVGEIMHPKEDRE